MQRRIFIAINLEDKVKTFIHKKIQNWEETFPAKWVGKDSYHITLMFLGYVEEQGVVDMADKLKKALDGMEAFDVMFDEFRVGPDKDQPKMIWLSGEKNDPLIELRHRIEQALSEYDLERKAFRPHITLARVPRRVLDQLPEIGQQKVSVLVPVGSVEIMESRYENKERKYYVMESIELG